jgi:predicted ATPase
MQSCIEQFAVTKHWAMLPFFMASTAELRLTAGDNAGAAGLLDQATELIGNTGEEWCVSEIMRLRARLTMRDPLEAAVMLQEAIAKAKSQHARLWELRCAISLAQLWRDQNSASAWNVLAPIYDRFTEGLQTPDVVSARHLLDELKA